MGIRNACIATLLISLATVTACDKKRQKTQEQEDRAHVNAQQAQYGKAQPIPFFDWSLERQLMIDLYGLRNEKVATHAVWRSEMEAVEGDCPSMGYGIPYDTFLTNPLMSEWRTGYQSIAGVSVGQAEPNGGFASMNTAATWVLCIDDKGMILPHYVESKVTVYPYAVKVDYDSNRVSRVGEKSVTLGQPINPEGE